MSKTRIILAALSITFLLVSGAFADEGMYPLSEIHKLNLASKGLKVRSGDIFKPGKVSLIDAIVQVGGCTGSFVSPEGLIITNHHCAFGAVQAASTTSHDYVTDGFIAPSKGEELPAKGYTVRITESYRDLSKEVLSAVADSMDFTSRTKAIEKRIKELVADAEKEHPGKRAEVAEMFAGKSYTLFLYTFLKDVRVVYVPPRSIGEFGGEDDNWVWPRHTGDFSFLRAYVAPDGAPADYSPSNVPYHPRKYLRVNPNGVEENDAVFILGYPGRTFRHRTSHYLSYEEEVRMPYVADLYEWAIAAMQEAGKHDRAIAIKHDSRMKGLANVMKNYRGKLKGMARLSLVANKREEERGLQSFIEAGPGLKAKYDSLLPDIGKIYDEMRLAAPKELALDYLRSMPILLNLAFTVYEASRELQKPDLEREAAYMQRNFARTKEGIQLALQNLDEPTDKLFFRHMLLEAAKLPEGYRIRGLDSLVADSTSSSPADLFLARAYRLTVLKDSAEVMKLLAKTPEELAALKDPLVQLAAALYPEYQQLKETRQRREGALSKLYGLLVDVKQQYLKKEFIPDANSTLRLTFGKIKGYSPADALFASPITTLHGVVEKTTGADPYRSPRKLIDLAKAGKHGRFTSKRLKDVPVALLYNLDTTGGNSGSPLLNADGDLVGVNFDRCFEATINDYAWSESYSRSIAVDIRYVLFVVDKFAGAGFLLSELGVPQGD